MCIFDSFRIYLNTSCPPEPGRGAWVALIQDMQTRELRKFVGVEPQTTMNRSILLAAIMTLSMTPVDVYVELYTTSPYMHGAANWIAAAKAEGGEAEPQSDLWLQFDGLCQQRLVTLPEVSSADDKALLEVCRCLAKAEKDKPL